MLDKLPWISLLMASSYFFASSMFSSSLPLMQTELATTESMVQNTISYFLIAVGISQLFWGIWSERLGRKPVFVLSGGGFILGSVLCSLAANIEILMMGRILQGIGTGGLYLLCRTIMQDSYTKERIMSILAWFSLFFISIPGLTPVVGGYLSEHWGWKSNFQFI